MTFNGSKVTVSDINSDVQLPAVIETDFAKALRKQPNFTNVTLENFTWPVYITDPSQRF